MGWPEETHTAATTAWELDKLAWHGAKAAGRGARWAWAALSADHHHNYYPDRYYTRDAGVEPTSDVIVPDYHRTEQLPSPPLGLPEGRGE
jgi:hypothetical protein